MFAAYEFILVSRFVSTVRHCSIAFVVGVEHMYVLQANNGIINLNSGIDYRRQTLPSEGKVYFV